MQLQTYFMHGSKYRTHRTHIEIVLELQKNSSTILIWLNLTPGKVYNNALYELKKNP
jgi:hypothetical protein